MSQGPALRPPHRSHKAGQQCQQAGCICRRIAKLVFGQRPLSPRTALQLLVQRQPQPCLTEGTQAMVHHLQGDPPRCTHSQVASHTGCFTRRLIHTGSSSSGARRAPDTQQSRQQCSPRHKQCATLQQAASTTQTGRTAGGEDGCRRPHNNNSCLSAPWAHRGLIGAAGSDARCPGHRPVPQLRHRRRHKHTWGGAGKAEPGKRQGTGWADGRQPEREDTSKVRYAHGTHGRHRGTWLLQPAMQLPPSLPSAAAVARKSCTSPKPSLRQERALH
jgi:hypothetical protein